MTQLGHFTFSKEGTEEDQAISQKMKETYLSITNYKVIENKIGEPATCKFMPSSEYVQIVYLNTVFSCSAVKTSLRLDSRYRKTTANKCTLIDLDRSWGLTNF